MDPAAAESLPLPPVDANTGTNTIFKELFAGTVSGWAQVMTGQPVSNLFMSSMSKSDVRWLGSCADSVWYQSLESLVWLGSIRHGQLRRTPPPSQPLSGHISSALPRLLSALALDSLTSSRCACSLATSTRAWSTAAPASSRTRGPSPSTRVRPTPPLRTPSDHCTKPIRAH